MLRQLHGEAFASGVSARSEFAATVRGLMAKVHSNAAVWRATLKRHCSLVHQHSDFMWDKPLSDIRSVTV